MVDEVSTPVNTVSRDNLSVLIMNNMFNNSVEFASDSDTMETNSPLRKPNTQAIGKKLFHSPMSDIDSPDRSAVCVSERVSRPSALCQERSKITRKRKQNLIPDSSEKIKKAFVKECEKDGYSPDVRGGMRKRVLISLFHNKEYSMDVS